MAEIEKTIHKHGGWPKAFSQLSILRRCGCWARIPPEAAPYPIGVKTSDATMNDSSEHLLLAVMARLIRIESMVCSLSILTLKHMSGDNVEEYQALSRWLGAIRGRIVETAIKSHAEQFPELANFVEEHVELSERDLTEMFEESRSRNRD
jgi:hypothetical protein